MFHSKTKSVRLLGYFDNRIADRKPIVGVSARSQGNSSLSWYFMGENAFGMINRYGGQIQSSFVQAVFGTVVPAS